MKNKLAGIVIIACLALVSGSVYAGPTMKGTPPSAVEPTPDPNKKKAGEECKSSDECQRHYACVKAGEKRVCTALPQPVMPPT
jgi:hypothetical protein